MKILVLFFSLLISVNFYSQDIVGSWKYNKMESVVKTNNEAVTKSIEKEISQMAPLDGFIVQFKKNGIAIIDGEHHVSYTVKNNMLSFDDEEVVYKIVDDFFVISFSLRMVNDKLLRKYSAEYPDLVIEQFSMDFYFARISDQN